MLTTLIFVTSYIECAYKHNELRLFSINTAFRVKFAKIPFSFAILIFVKIIHHEYVYRSLRNEQQKCAKGLQDQIVATRKEIQRLKKMEEQLHTPQVVEDTSAKQTPSSKALPKLSLRLNRKKVIEVFRVEC